MNDTIWLFLSLVVLFIIGLLIAAAQGSIVAVVFVTWIGVVVTMLATGLMISYIMKVQADKQQQMFQDNMRENFLIMNQAAKTQNALSQGALRMLSDSQRLQLPATTNDELFTIDADIFDELN